MPGPRILGIQMDLVWEDAAANRARAGELLRSRPPTPGALAVLPEMFTSGFSMNAAAVAEPAGGETERWMSTLAAERQVTLIAGLARRNGEGVCGNDAVVAGPAGEVMAVYRKQRPFVPGGEHQSYTAGCEPAIFRWSDLKVAVFICYDLRFPELFRVAARKTPEVYAVIASWPDVRIAHWVKLLQARAIENQAYVVGVNRVGDDPAHHYNGRSVIVDPWGEILADAGETEGVIEADLDVPRLRNYREKLPFLHDLEDAR